MSIRSVAALAAAFLTAVPAAGAAQVAIRGETVYTMAGAPIRDGVVLIGRDGKIAQVGPAGSVRIPNGVRVLRGKVVTPGLIDAHSTVGFSGILNQPQDQDQLETSAPLQPELRAVDAYDPLDRLVAYVRDYGVTTLHTGHGPGALASGQTMVVKTRGTTVQEALVDTLAMVAMTLGPDIRDNFKSPGTPAKSVAMLRQEFIKAQEYDRKVRAATADHPVARDLRLEMVAAMLRGEVPALITAHRAVDILDALRLQREFGFKLVLDGASEAYLVVDQIKAAGVPVIIHPTMMRTGGATRNAAVTTAKLLIDAGIPVAMQSGYEDYVPKTRIVLWEAGMAAGYGLPFDQALATITINAARILGLESRIGSLAAGKDGDVAVFDGDPFEYTTHVCGVTIQGEVVSDRCH
ncbi:MAG TPA: amidohydrolase family protein [Gemmatimonadales bacterium]|nr:amidohydrolase family protein [Gemmatimonadales bacterium]